MQERILTSIIARELKTKSIMLIGPRQTGKSTLLKGLGPDLIVDLSDEVVFRDHLKDPALIRAKCAALPQEARILVDEIQRIPSMLNSIQSMIDNNESGRRFLLTGSSVRKLKRGQANLLPGRVFWHSLFPLTYWELKDQWDLERALTRGTLPEIYLQDYGADLLGSYIDTYLREEVQAEALTRNLGTYARFLDLAAENSGLITNYSQLASDSEIPKETLRRFYDLLTDTLLAHRVSGYRGVASKRKAKQKEMFVFFDVGVRNGVLRQHRNTFTPTQLGKLFEQWLILQVIAFASYRRLNWQFHYYRDDKKSEVDLIIDQGNRVLAVEIKFSTSFKPEFTKSLLEFQTLCNKPTKCLIVYRGETKQARDGIDVLPYTEFLDQLENV